MLKKCALALALLVAAVPTARASDYDYSAYEAFAAAQMYAMDAYNYSTSGYAYWAYFYFYYAMSYSYGAYLADLSGDTSDSAIYADYAYYLGTFGVLYATYDFQIYGSWYDHFHITQYILLSLYFGSYAEYLAYVSYYNYHSNRSFAP